MKSHQHDWLPKQDLNKYATKWLAEMEKGRLSWPQTLDRGLQQLGKSFPGRAHPLGYQMVSSEDIQTSNVIETEQDLGIHTWIYITQHTSYIYTYKKRRKKSPWIWKRTSGKVRGGRGWRKKREWGSDIIIIWRHFLKIAQQGNASFK